MNPLHWKITLFVNLSLLVLIYSFDDLFLNKLFINSIVIYSLLLHILYFLTLLDRVVSYNCFGKTVLDYFFVDDVIIRSINNVYFWSC